jgi:DNA repair protein RadA/Sms
VAPIGSLEAVDTGEQRISSGIDGLDRVLGGGLVPASVMLLAGEPGIGKSTLLLQMLANLTERGRECLLASGEESREQVAARAARLGLNGREISFAPGRELDLVLATARAARPFLLAVDSIQTLRDTAGSQAPGGVAQVRRCADALVGLAKNEGIAVLMTGHVTKDGELAGPRALEHAVDVVCTFDGDSRSGLRVLAAGKNRFGAEGEAAWFEIGPAGLHEINPSELLISGDELPGSAIALPLAGRRAIAVEVQALFGTDDGSARRYVSGLEARRFQLVAAVLERLGGLPLGKADLYGATAGGLRVDDPGCDLAIAAALASAKTARPPPARVAFVGEISLTGKVRPVPGMTQRLTAARAAGCDRIFAPTNGSAPAPVIPVGHVSEALSWAS